MSRRATFASYRPRSILNKHKHADHWFWTRYSAYPYLGCQHACEFCYCRERKYLPHTDPDDFAYDIRVKENAPELLRRALAHAPRDVVMTGDYQPAEHKFQLSRRMLEVCLEQAFPVFILERSPFVLRDLDVIEAIHARARAVVAFSIISTPESANAERIRRIERLTPSPEKRFAAMRTLARAGIPTGTCLMPVLPGLCDDDANLEAVVRWTAEHGGQFVLAGGLTLADQQRDYFLRVMGEQFSDLAGLYARLYPQGSYAAVGDGELHIRRRVRELCAKYGLSDRMPRPIVLGEKRESNKRAAEWLGNRSFTSELEGEPLHRVWAYRKAAWAVDEMAEDLDQVYRTLGADGLGTVPDIGPRLAAEVGRFLHDPI